MVGTGNRRSSGRACSPKPSQQSLHSHVGTSCGFRTHMIQPIRFYNKYFFTPPTHSYFFLIGIRSYLSKTKGKSFIIKSFSFQHVNIQADPHSRANEIHTSNMLVPVCGIILKVTSDRENRCRCYTRDVATKRGVATGDVTFKMPSSKVPVSLARMVVACPW